MSKPEKSLLVIEEKTDALRRKWGGLKSRTKRGLKAARKQLVDVKGKAGNKVSAAVRSVRIAVPEGLALGRRIIGR